MTTVHQWVRRWSRVLNCAAAGCCMCAIGCQGRIIPPPQLPPPFSHPQPVPDWSDPQKQGKVSIATVDCVEAGPRMGDPDEAPMWFIYLKFRLIGSTKEAVKKAAYAMAVDNLSILGPFVATLTEASGASNPVVAPIRRLPTPGELHPTVEPLLPSTPELQASGDWMCEVHAVIYAAQRPGPVVDLAIDGEALRLGAIEVGCLRRTASIPAGGLTGGTFRITIPDPKPDAPTSSGAGIGQTLSGG